MESSVSCDATSYVAGSTYATGQEVENDGTKYECKIGGWCSSTSVWAYEPGVGSYWEQAWVEVGPCASGPIAPTVSLTSPVKDAILGNNKGYEFTVNAQDPDGIVTQVVYDFTTPSGQTLQAGSTISPFPKCFYHKSSK